MTENTQDTDTTTNSADAEIVEQIEQLDQDQLRKFGSYTLITGILLIILGTVGVALPGLMSLATSVFIGWLFLIGGLFWGYHTFRSHKGGWLDWFKPALLVVAGGLMLWNPVTGIAAVGLMLSFYLFLDAFGSFALAKEFKPQKGWGWMVFNGIVSLVLAVLFLIGWPVTSLVLVGIYVGISLIFDGWALVMIGWAVKKGSK